MQDKLKPEVERVQFKRLIAENPNYFGTLAKSPFKPVKKMAFNTQYEELNCVGFNPATNFLEATIAIKLPYGYGGDLCQPGTTEYVRFFIDYGSGWEDAGLAGVSVHDIPTGQDCAKQSDKPLTYVASLKIQPKTQCCNHPVLPKVRAILSWQWIPPAGGANAGWVPPWGNVLECSIQIRPHPWNILCLLDVISEGIGQELKVPPLLEQVKYQPIPIPDPPPYKLAELAKLYAAKPTATAVAENFTVEPHRFGLSSIQSVLTAGGLNQDLLTAKMAEWNAVGINWAAALAALDNTNANVTYEQLECLGIDDTIPERLVATFRIKRPSGYSGDLCRKGSIEYVAFWADWDDTCQWTYLATVQVNVHDIASIPKDGLCYSAILPVDLTYHRRTCDKPKIARIRAVLSWSVPPSTTDPNALNYWGNRLDTHVQIDPGDPEKPGEFLYKIRNLGGIPIEDIDTPASGMTLLGAVFGHYPAYPADAWGLDRACPFGGNVIVEGQYYFGYYYRVKVHKVGEPYTSFTVLADSFQVERWDFGFDLQTSVGGFYKYFDPALYIDRTLANWGSSGDALWEVQLDVATAPNEASIINSTPWYRLQLDNTAPAPPPASPATIDIHISAGGDCKDATQGSKITGTFVADDLHFGAWSLSTEPNTLTTPSNQPAVSGLANTDPAPLGYTWTLDTASPIAMKPCGYVVRLDVWDRTIVNSLPGEHNWNDIEVGFCLRAES